MVNGLHLYIAILTSGHSKCFTILPNIHPVMHKFTHQWLCQPRNVTSAGQKQVGWGVLLRHLDTLLGGPGDRTSNLPVTSQPALPPKPPTGLYYIAGVSMISLDRSVYQPYLSIIRLGRHSHLWCTIYYIQCNMIQQYNVKKTSFYNLYD